MATSMVPSEAPKKNSDAPSMIGVADIANIGNTATNPKPPNKTIGRAPWRADTTPVIGIATIDPMPRHSKSNPNCPSSAPTFALMNGKSGAQQAMAKPAAKKARRVASRAGAVDA